MNNNSYIHIDKLSKSFGFKKVLNEISLDIDKGDFVTLFGPNGAGKTTLIRILSTILKPDEGSIYISGYGLKKDVQKIRGIVGLLSHDNFLYQNLTVMENLTFFSKLYGIKDPGESLSNKLNKIGAYSRRNELVRNLSSGLKQRISIVRSMVHNPDIVFLDEPFVGLDIEGSEYLLEIFKEMKKENKTALVTTHDIRLGLHECSRVVVLNKGEIKYNEKSEHIDKDRFEEKYKSLLA